MWKLKGKISNDNWKGKLANSVFGDHIEYHAKFAGGSLVVITYGVDAKMFGRPFPTLNVLWGCLPLDNGLSKVRMFFVAKKRSGIVAN